MDQPTFIELSRRVARLEIALSTPTTRKAPLLRELADVRSALQQLYSKHPELPLVNGILEGLHLENEMGEGRKDEKDTDTKNTIQDTKNTIQDIDIQDTTKNTIQDTNTNIQNTDNDSNTDDSNTDTSYEVSKSGDLSTDMKRRLVLLKKREIHEAYNNLEQLARFDIASLVNHVSQSQNKTHDMNKDLLKAVQAKPRVDALAQRVHEIEVKNSLLCERYMEMVVRENAFQMDVKRRLARLEGNRRE